MRILCYATKRFKDILKKKHIEYTKWVFFFLLRVSSAFLFSIKYSPPRKPWKTKHHFGNLELLPDLYRGVGKKGVVRCWISSASTDFWDVSSGQEFVSGMMYVPLWRQQCADISAVCPENFCQPYYFCEQSTATHSALAGQDVLIQNTVWLLSFNESPKMRG